MKSFRILFSVLVVSLIAGCSHTQSGNQARAEAAPLSYEAPHSAHASWYGGKFHGRLTANGERYDQNGMTAAHKTLPFNTMLYVENPANGRSVVVRVNDRGPFIKGRDIDLSRGAAAAIDLIPVGVGQVNYGIIPNGED